MAAGLALSRPLIGERFDHEAGLIAQVAQIHQAAAGVEGAGVEQIAVAGLDGGGAHNGGWAEGIVAAHHRADHRGDGDAGG